MKLFTTLFALSLTLLAVESVTPAKKATCDTAEFDTCANRLLMLGDEKFVFPTNLEGMNKRCKEVKTLEKCTKDFTKSCLRSDTKNSISVLMYGISKANKGYCTSASRKKIFISFGACVNSHKKRLAKIFEQFTRDLHGIKLYPEARLRIPLACCNYFEFKQGVVKYLTGKCNDLEVHEVESLIDNYAQDILGLLCGDYTDESDKCSKVIEKTPKWSGALTSKIFILPLVDVLESV